jgi:hypothetical protein
VSPSRRHSVVPRSKNHVRTSVNLRRCTGKKVAMMNYENADDKKFSIDLKIKLKSVSLQTHILFKKKFLCALSIINRTKCISTIQLTYFKVDFRLNENSCYCISKVIESN